MCRTDSVHTSATTSDVLSRLPMEIIKPPFDRRMLRPGHIYFLNTQKLGQDTRLTTLGDRRQYTIYRRTQHRILLRWH